MGRLKKGKLPELGPKCRQKTLFLFLNASLSHTPISVSNGLKRNVTDEVIFGEKIGAKNTVSQFFWSEHVLYKKSEKCY